MLIDAHTVEPGTLLEADICVVGTGPAGMTLLKRLAAPGIRLVAIESGGRLLNVENQALCEGKIISSDYPAGALMSSRRRQLGGTAHLWNDELDAGQGNELVRLVQLDAIDFEKRSWVPHSGWPFSKSKLQPFYNEALEILGAGALPDNLPEDKSHPEFLSSNGRVLTVLSQFVGRTVFSRDYPETVAQDDRITVYLNATVLELVTHDNAVTFARVAAVPGREFQVAARFFVIAGGGIENARILLLSNRNSAPGLGNQHDLVGRFFMDHPSFRIGVLTPAKRNLFGSAAQYDHHLVNGRCLMGKFTFRPETMRQEQMLNICITLGPRERDYESAAVKAVKRIIRSRSKKDALRLIGRELQTIAGGWDELLVRCYHKLVKAEPVYFENKGGWSRLANPERRFHKFELCCLAEQAPNPENRVTLGDDVDRFGQRKTELHWRWSDVDLRSIGRAQELLKDDLQSLGELVTQRELDDGALPSVATPHHHIGTTRMHDDPRYGVVDANCRVHGISNLYISGSSVFTTGGFANPTLTIVALALRLAYHLEELMKPALSSVSTPAAASSPPS